MEERRPGRLPAWLVYTVLRVLSFVVPLVIAVALGASLLLAALIAAIVGLCISIIFLARQRRALAGEIASLRVRPERPRPVDLGADELAEDAAVDGTPAPSADQNGNANAAARPRP